MMNRPLAVPLPHESARIPHSRPKHRGCPVGASPVLREADLVKLGNVLLHAQETASCSIERALQTNGDESASALSNVLDDGVNRNAYRSPLAATASCCLWCNAAPADTGTPLHRYGNVASTQATKPYNRMRTTTTSARHHYEDRQQPHRRLARDTQYPTPSQHRPHHNKPRKDIDKERGPGTRESCDQTPFPSPLENISSSQAAGVEHSSSPNKPLGASEHVLLDQDGGDYTTPDALFCSWGCARKWNDRFSPLQTRHERGLRIDIAAGSQQEGLSGDRRRHLPPSVRNPCVSVNGLEAFRLVSPLMTYAVLTPMRQEERDFAFLCCVRIPHLILLPSQTPRLQSNERRGATAWQREHTRREVPDVLSGSQRSPWRRE